MMTDFLLALIGAAIAFAALMPLLKTGGQTIAAFMSRQHVLTYCAATAAQLVALFVGALLAATLSRDSNDAMLRLGAAVAMLATVYAANWIIQRTLLKNTP
jgi:membrane associated rhomboid family serine protease